MKAIIVSVVEKNLKIKERNQEDKGGKLDEKPWKSYEEMSWGLKKLWVVFNLCPLEKLRTAWANLAESEKVKNTFIVFYHSLLINYYYIYFFPNWKNSFEEKT